MSAPDVILIPPEGQRESLLLDVVEQIKKGKQLQWANRSIGDDWTKCRFEDFCSSVFSKSWEHTFLFRIAPEPTVVPYTVDTCPLGAAVRSKHTGCRYIISGAETRSALVGSIWTSYGEILECYEKLDPRSGNWFPAGTVEGGVK